MFIQTGLCPYIDQNFLCEMLANTVTMQTLERLSSTVLVNSSDVQAGETIPVFTGISFGVDETLEMPLSTFLESLANHATSQDPVSSIEISGVKFISDV